MLKLVPVNIFNGRDFKTDLLLPNGKRYLESKSRLYFYSISTVLFIFIFFTKFQLFFFSNWQLVEKCSEIPITLQKRYGSNTTFTKMSLHLPIYSAKRRGFPSLERVQILRSVLCNFAVIRVLPFLNNPKDLDPSYKTDLEFWDCFGRKKNVL